MTVYPNPDRDNSNVIVIISRYACAYCLIFGDFRDSIIETLIMLIMGHSRLKNPVFKLSFSF